MKVFVLALLSFQTRRVRGHLTGRIVSLIRPGNIAGGRTKKLSLNVVSPPTDTDA